MEPPLAVYRPETTVGEAIDDTTITTRVKTQMLNDPQFQFSATPRNVMTMTGFMHRIDRLKTRPDSWKELFFPEAHALPGS